MRLFAPSVRYVVSVVVLSSYFFSVVCVPTAKADPIDIPAGTRVLCAFGETIDPVTATVGQKITLKVVEPVMVNGVTVIDTGALVTGEVTQSRKRGAIGKPAIIGVTLFSVTAVDGMAVPISGQKVSEGEDKQTTSLVITILCCVLGLLAKGGPTSIPSGSQMEGTVTGLARVDVKTQP